MEDNLIHFDKLSIDNDKIRRLGADKKRQYLMLTNMLRDLMVLQKILIIIEIPDNNIEIYKSAHVTTAFLFVKILIGKIFEMWKFIKDEDILEEKNKYSANLRNKLEQVEDFFGEKRNRKLFKFIRNKFAFHYESKKEGRENIEQLISEIMDGLPNLEMWLSTNDSGNDIFKSSNDIMVEAVLKRMRLEGFEGDQDALLKTLFLITFNVSGLFREFVVSYLTEVILEGVYFRQVDTIAVMAKPINEVKFPLFIRRNKA